MFNVPNLFSLGNLLCGCIATLTVIEGNLLPAAFLVMLASLFDFLDGFAARGLKQGSPMGKELDSLADMVTFGVVPGMVMFQLIRVSLAMQPLSVERLNDFLPYLGFVVPLFSGLRLAKFNVDTRQSESFIGLPTLANALFVCGLPYWMENTSLCTTGASTEWVSAYEKVAGAGLSRFMLAGIFPVWALAAITLLFSFLLISPLPMFSFKVKNVKWKGNEIRYVFLLLSAMLVVFLRVKALSVIIVLYVLMSLVNNLFSGKEGR